MERIAVFPGSFDPITLGHLDLVQRAIPLFDEISVAIGVNPAKKYLFTLEQRLEFLEQTFAGMKTVRVVHYEGLTIDYCKKTGANYILRGLRNGTDFDYECSIAQMNKAVNEEVESIFLMTSPKFMAINSSIVRELIRHGEDVSQFLPAAVKIP